MSEVKRYEVKGKFESTGPEGISLIDPKMVLEDDYDAKCHAADVYFGSWKRTEQELDAQRLRADTAEAELSKMTEFRDNAAKKIFRMRAEITAAEQRIAEQASILEEMATEMTLAISDSQIRAAMTVIGRTRFLQLLQAHNSRVDAALSTASPATINQQGENDQ